MYSKYPFAILAHYTKLNIMILNPFFKIKERKHIIKRVSCQEEKKPNKSKC
jgi:hypothetical protein